MSAHRSGNREKPEGYRRALDLLHDCVTPDGFLASPTHRHNYHRVWARDGVVLGLAALTSGDSELVDTFRRTLRTLARNQGPHGEIPSNVDESGRVSYGNNAGRVDSDLWFVIGCGRYLAATGDGDLIEELLPVLEKVRFLLGAWEVNARGLLYVPQAGDWADEYLHHGYVLYDQLLYLRAQRELCWIHRDHDGEADRALAESAARLERLIRANYWFDEEDEIPDDVYHEVLYRQGREKASPHCAGHHWISFFAPQGYGYRFDALANVLASLLGVADEDQVSRVDRFIESEGMIPDDLPILPAFYPVIEPMDRDWEELEMTFSYTFKNRPHEYHNGGLWPMVTGFYVADLASRGRIDEARRLTDGIHAANALAMDDRSWIFPEYVHGRRLTAGGTPHQGWSAAAAVLAEHALDGEILFEEIPCT